MNYFFSPSKLAFYVDVIHGTAMPSDVVAITAATYEQIMSELSTTYGAVLSASSAGQPIVSVPALTEAQLTTYAQGKASTIDAGGITVNIGTTAAPENVECATDNATYLRLIAAYNYVQSNPSATQAFAFSSGVITLTGAQIETIYQAITAFYMSVTTELATIIAAIKAGTITTYAEVNSPPSTISAWPSNS